MPIGGLVSRVARTTLPKLFSEGGMGAIERGIVPIQVALRNRGGEIGAEVATALRSSRNIARRTQGRFLSVMQPHLDSLTPAENLGLAQGLLGNTTSGRPAQIIQSMSRIFQVTGESPKKVIDTIVARGTPLSQEMAQDGRRLLGMILAQHEDDLAGTLARIQAKPLIDTIPEGGIKNLAQAGLNTMLARGGRDLYLSQLRAFNTATLLGRAVIVNASQPTLSTIVAGLKPFAQTLQDISTRRGRQEMRRFALQIGEALDGAITDYIRHDLKPGKLQRASEAVLRRTGFLAVERFNRRFAAAMGRHWFDDLARKATLGDELALKQLQRFGVDLRRATRNALNQSDLENFAQNFVTETQFRLTPEELPLAADNEFWRTAMQFKTFGLKATELMLRDIETRGLGQFAARAIPSSIAVGVPTITLRRLSSGQAPLPEGDRNDLSYWLKLMSEGSFAIGYGGMLFDLLQASERESVAEFLAGPTFGGLSQDIASATIGPQGLLRGNLRNPASRVIERTPTLGPALRRGFQSATRPTPPARRGRVSPAGNRGRERGR